MSDEPYLRARGSGGAERGGIGHSGRAVHEELRRAYVARADAISRDDRPSR